MRHRWRRARDEAGQASFSVVVVIVVVILAGILVWRVAATAEDINEKAEVIQETAVPINTATDAVLNLPRTRDLANSILQTADPLEGKLAEITRLAQSVDGIAKSINASATTVDGTAKGINGSVANILDTARSIDRGVRQIIINLDTTLGIVRDVKGATGNILGTAGGIHQDAACIDNKVPELLNLLGGLLGGGGGAGTGPDAHC